MRKRPLDFFGPEDWDGESDPQEQIADIERRQTEWDEEFASLPWWKRLWISVVGL